MMNEIKAFYKINPPKLDDITDLKYRHFRLRNRNGRFVKVGRKIRANSQLQEYLMRYSPLDVYYSTACWLNPEKLGARTSGDVLSNMFLYADVVFDVDRKPFSVKNIEAARRDTVRLLDAVRGLGLEAKYLSFSGGKGFHIVCKDPNRYDGADPLGREAKAVEYRRRLVESLSTHGIEFDRKITVDTRRILRVPGTINASTGFVCTTITEEQLNTPAAELLKYVPRVSINAPLIPRGGDDPTLRVFRTTLGRLNRLGVRSRPTEYYASFLSSGVLGIRRQTLILKYTLAKRNSLEAITSRLRKLQDDYNLGGMHVFRDEGEAYVVCLDTLQERRLEKILKASGSPSHTTLLKYHQTYMRVGKLFDKRGRVFGKPPRYVKTIEPGNPRNAYVSRPHYLFFKENGVPLPEYERQHGGSDVFITHALMED